MRVCKGKSVYRGTAVGKLRVLMKKEQTVVRCRVDDVQAELARFDNAVEEAKRVLGELYEKALTEVGETNAAIFEIHAMMLEDEDYLGAVRNIISEQCVNAEYAAAATGDDFAQMFAQMDDDYMKERAADVRDITERLIGLLTGADGAGADGDEPYILLADDLAPSETVQLDKSKVLAIVTVHGSVNSHTAILARTMNIPALVKTDTELSEGLNGKIAVVDGSEGMMYIEPTDEVLDRAEKKRTAELEKRRLLQELKGKPNVTKDGKSVMLYANAGSPSDIMYALENDAGGIGLFRSEFIYLGRDTYPTEEEQFAVYKKAAQLMAGKRVIIRTLDIGADKQADYFNLPHEENPAMGVRAIRICLKQPELFKTQLRAIYRASAYGKIAVMYPMITSVREVEEIKKISAEVRAQLDECGVKYGDVEEGIMIETPAAVMISDMLAERVDFFSIGTNDLSQYTMAIDRSNTELDEFFDAHHPAVMRMIELVCKNAHEHGIWAGICGELGADAELTGRFLRMGVDELSVSPSAVLGLREKIRSIDLSK